MTLSTSNTNIFTLTCQKIHEDTHNVKTFLFSYPKSVTKEVFKYYSGQHITFPLNIQDKIHHCCYTLSSSPTNLDFVSITIKRIPQGTVSNYFHDNFQIGQSIITKNASGSFYLPAPAPEKLLLLCAGSGITPMLSMLRYLVETQQKSTLIFICSAQKTQDLIAREEISYLAKTHGNCKIVYTLTQEEDSLWQGSKGRIEHSMLRGIQQISDYEIFVCGPKLFRKTAQQLLQQLNFPRSQYHYESFGELEYTRANVNGSAEEHNNNSPQRENKNVNQVITNKKVSILFKRWNKTYQGNNQDPILDQGEKAGLILPYSCRGGSCGSCRAKLISGEVSQNSTDGLTDVEKNNGYILLCSCTPITDIEVSHE